MGEFRSENWIIIGLLTPCIIAVYLVLILMAYHTFCKKRVQEVQERQGEIIEVKIELTRLKILPVLTREHYTSLLHWV
jgi:hypothetical protein